jgi:parallel beta-helix repeat protein
MAVALTSLSVLVSLPNDVSALTPHAPILIDGNADFTVANGVAGGVGTYDTPFVIEGWDIDAATGRGIEIRNTDAHFVIRNVTIHSGRTNLNDGVYLNTAINGRVENATVSDNLAGIHLVSSGNITVISSKVSNNSLGMYLESSRDSAIVSNEISNGSYGIYLSSSVNISIMSNVFFDDGVFLWGSSPLHFDSHIITPDNTVNGLPIYYYTSCMDVTVDRVAVGQLIFASCLSVSVSNLNIARTEAGIEMAYVDDGFIGNSKVSDSLIGILLYSSTGISMFNDTVTSSTTDAISIWSSPNTTIAQGRFSDNWRGIYASSSANISITMSTVSNSTREGLLFISSPYPTIARNTLSNNLYGVSFDSSPGVVVHHNNFLGNVIQASDNNPVPGSWDDGYPSGGNCWSDYHNSDLYSGPNQDQPEGDGIGDVPYAVNFESRDRYPLMEQYPDLVPPALAIASPMDGQYFTAIPVAVTGTAYDLGGLDRVEVRTNGGLWMIATGKSSWTASTSLALGSNQIDARALDRSGNPSAVQSVAVFYDPDRPTLAISDPADGQWFNVSTITVTGTAFDALSGLNRVEISCNDGASWSNAAGTDTWTSDCVGLADGSHRIQARAFDKAGLESTHSTVTVQVDTTRPILAITAPPDGEWLNTTTAMIKGTASETGSGFDRVEVSCDGGTTWFVASGTISWTHVCTGLVEGLNTVRARVFDMVGWESARAEILLHVDITPPAITITAPSGGGWVTSPVMTVIGTASDFGGGVARVEVSCNGGLTWNQAAGTVSWTHDCTLTAGTNVLQARAFDTVGWESTRPEVTLRYDPDAPAIAIASPLDDQWMNSSSVVLNGTTGDPAGPGMSGLDQVQVSCDGGVTWGRASGTSSWTYACSGLLDGTHVLRARAFDIAGSESAHATVTVQVDTVPPTIAIAVPADGAMIRDSTLSVAGTASDDNILTAVKIRVGTGNWIDATGTMGWSATVSLAPGENKIEAQSHDRAGNPSLLASITVVYDDERPQVTIDCDNLIVDEGSTVRCTVYASDNQSTPSVSWTVTKDGQPVASGAGPNVTFAASESGDYIVEAIATDKAGNAETAGQTITSRLIISVERPADLFWLMILVIIIVAAASLVVHAYLVRQSRKRHEERHRDDLSSMERQRKPER